MEEFKMSIVKMYDGSIREWETIEEWSLLQDENWKLIQEERKLKEEITREKIKTIELYVNTLNKDSVNEIGLVYTKIEEDINDYNSFRVYVNKGYTIEHKYISLDEIA
jgi:hypothetical protein